ncbi:cysteine desulfurase family protein [Bacillus alkalicellulosilyticus]|uniref:cysteine desulfurase family protein n=1 Tax=Alkalihalobacterium alkalicellulosilyticum TaxID=1912214 RepID=UPI0009965056|nr:cysteine desulfurase family protein [Bacillus alkalicellulosilyticus]
MIYLDNSATTKPYKDVLDTYVKVSETYFGNPSSLHNVGLQAEQLIIKSRQLVASLLKVDAKEVVFTSGGTESNNLAIKGIAFEHSGRGKHLITTSVEHPSIDETFKSLEKIGYDVTYLPVDENGIVRLEDVRKALRSDTILVSMIHVNNETGAIQPVKEIGKLLSRYPKVFFHVDHVQGITKVPLSLKEAKIDLCTISAHKFHGLKGNGVLYVRSGVRLSPILLGGVQEAKLRAGTENVAGAAALAKALRLSMEQAKNVQHLYELKRLTCEKLSTIEGIFLNSKEKNFAPHIVNFSIPGAKPEVIIQSLSEKNIYVSTKSACSSKLASPSRVLLAMGVGKKKAESGIRVSFSFENTKEEVLIFTEIMSTLVPELLEVMR